MKFWKDKKVVVTGGNGFLGRFVVEKLRQNGCQNIFVPDIKDYDLVKMEAVQKMYSDAKPDIV
ncbi:MAG: sugar nucleotide-binding protein, partial [Candidatus Omnitrophica bacterium]|nr:sugar nucleotide-binding protein [Candidatus Omnitrophota bacterium]